MERIQAIAQNVSDIAGKVDQILRHSLLLHSKGGAGAPARLGPVHWMGRPGGALASPTVAPQALSRATQGSLAPTWSEELRTAKAPGDSGGSLHSP